MKRLAMAAFCAVCGLWLAWAVWLAPKNLRGWDFAGFYVAAHVPLHSLYDHAVFVDFGERELKPLGVSYYPPFVRPAVFALPLKPLTQLSYRHALWLWISLGFAAYAAALYLLFRHFALPWLLLPAFASFAPAVLWGIILGQDITVYLLVLAVALLLLLRGHNVSAGLLLAICAYKFQLVLFLPLVLMLKGRRRALFAFGLGTAVEAAASAALVSPFEYLRFLSAVESYSYTLGYHPGGLRGATIALAHAQWYYPLALFAALGCGYLIWKLPLLEASCVAIAGSLFLTPHACVYDCTLLVIPMAVAWRQGGKFSRAAVLVLLLIGPIWVFGLLQAPIFAELFLIASSAARAWPRKASCALGSVARVEATVP